jgi:hypothetical protein
MKKILNFNIHKKITHFLNLIIINIIIFCLLTIQLNAKEDLQNNQLIIDFPNEIYEGYNFPISVYILTNNTPYYQIDVQIIFNNKSYNITYDEPEIIIEAPQVNQDTYFKIVAIKTGYLNDENYILIINNENENKSNLIITLLDNDFIVDGNTYFSVLISDEKGIPISNATVGIQSYISKDSIDKTDENGRARIYAPNHLDEIIILAQKNGYNNATEKIWINTNPNIIEKIIQNPNNIIIISIIILLIAIIIVTIRRQGEQLINKKQKPHKINNIEKKIDKTNQLNQKNSKNKKDDNNIKESKIEEIRINKKEPTQKIVTITNKKEIKKTNFQKHNRIKRNKDWFEGIDDIRFKIDKLTKDIESINENEWFEGKENLRKKIDDKLKKNKQN